MSVPSTHSSTRIVGSASASISPGPPGRPSTDSTEGLAKSASTSRTSLSNSAAIESARLVAQNVLPSPGSGEQTSTRCALGSPSTCASCAARSNWRFTIRNSSSSALTPPSGSIRPCSRKCARSIACRTPEKRNNTTNGTSTFAAGASAAGDGSENSGAAGAATFASATGCSAGDGSAASLATGRLTFDAARSAGTGAGLKLPSPNVPLARSNSDLPSPALSGPSPSGGNGILLCSVTLPSSRDHAALNEFDRQQHQEQRDQPRRPGVEQLAPLVLQRLCGIGSHLRDRADHRQLEDRLQLARGGEARAQLAHAPCDAAADN